MNENIDFLTFFYNFACMKNATSLKKKEIKKFEQTVLESIRPLGKCRILTTFSGGADSMALLVALANLKKTEGFVLEAIHCNFNLRGAESLRDREFAIKTCLKYGIKLHVAEFDVPDYIKKNGGSIEMVCRELRYAEFHRLRKLYAFDRIAVAHNADDNIETLLMNLFRGSGLNGIAAMQTDNNYILRPLLGVTRMEIEGYLENLGEHYVIDSSNLDIIYRRNFIRNEILPIVESRWPGVRKALYRTMKILDEERQTLKVVERRLLDSTPGKLPYSTIEEAPDASWLIHRFALRYGASHTIALEISDSFAGGAERYIGKKWETENGIITFSRNALEFLDSKRLLPDDLKEKCLENSEELMKQITASRDNSVLWLPFPLSECLVRKPQPGDRLKPLGMKGSKLVSDIIKDAKTDPATKRNLMVVEYNGEILWVEGLRRSRLYLVTPADRHIYRISRSI